MADDSKTAPVRQCSPEQMRLAGQLYITITKMLKGKDGAAALTALLNALCACSKAVGLDKQQVIDAIHKTWDKT